MKLIIVESPTKTKSISKFLGKEYKLLSSYGHIRDLPQKGLGVDIKNNFKPEYVISDKAKKVVKELREAAKKSDLIILATDEDREGEAIAWHILHALKMNEKGNYQRIVFHEITKSAIEKALENPRKIDINLVDAQQARRILDRLVGYKLSPFLWKKVARGLSAGRVQSVAVRLIVDKEREIEAFKPEEYWSIEANLKKQDNPEEFIARLAKKDNKKIDKLGIKDKKEADEILKELKGAEYKISDIQKKETKKYPAPPFKTSTLQQEASRKLGFSAKQTMRLAQQLYEAGLITYHRTDSLNLSNESLRDANEFIKNKFGLKYISSSPRFYKTKSKGAQEAHEAIRPTKSEHDPDEIKNYPDGRQYKLYRLIWQRFIASQMNPAILDNVAIDIQANGSTGSPCIFRANGSTIKFDGFLKIYPTKLKEKNLPELNKEEILELIKLISEQHFTQPPARYTEASLVKILEEYGIGRPSTYASIISVIQDRKYVEKDDQKRFVPAEIGFTVIDILKKHFPKIVDVKFTANVEENLDKISEGKQKWQDILKEFYEPFEKNLKKKTEEVKKEDFQKKLGRKCPECKSELVEKFGRFGKFIACTNYPECKYTEKSADDKKKEDEIRKNEGDEKGDIICDKCGSKMEIKNGPYGMFLGCSKYPECKNIKKIENKTGVKCPECKKGEIVERKSKKGRIFYSCSKYPKCKFALWDKPIKEECPKCKSLLVQTKNNKIKCSNKECAYKKDD
ncbi:MAG: type I DNA topoisomerase [Patescibacteria group bacterium]